MRTVRPDGTLSDKPLDSSDATKWLQELLLRGNFQKAQVCKVTSHGLKATALSWAAKWGLGREQRQILGYHIVEGASSALHYSRDEQSAPLRALEQVYESTRDGGFSPDATRSGYFRKKRGTVAASVADPMVASARQVVDDRYWDSELQEGSHSLLLSSTVCAAPQEELTEVKYENLHHPDEILMVAESTTSDSDSSSSNSSGEIEGGHCFFSRLQ